MANLTVNISPELENMLESLANLDGVAEKMLDAGMDVLEKEFRLRAEAHVRTGEMVGSIKRQPPKRSGGGVSAVIRPTGTGRKGVRNMEKLAFMEYGTSHQRATPVIGPAIAASESGVMSAMQEVFEKEAGKK
jgi:phage protein, HK97 gp10 family